MIWTGIVKSHLQNRFKFACLKNIAINATAVHVTLYLSVTNSMIQVSQFVRNSQHCHFNATKSLNCSQSLRRCLFLCLEAYQASFGKTSKIPEEKENKRKKKKGKNITRWVTDFPMWIQLVKWREYDDCNEMEPEIKSHPIDPSSDAHEDE